MPEPVTTATLAAISAYLAKDGVNKLLGPTAEYLGEGLRDFTKRRVENIKRIFRSAENKLGDRLDQPGQVPPRVLRAILNEGSFNEDTVVLDYFGGILASSRTELGRDDRGAAFAQLLDTLSSYQIRTHYIVYTLLRRVFSDSGRQFNEGHQNKMNFFVPRACYCSSMQFSGDELLKLGSLVSHSLSGLAEKALVGGVRYGPSEFLLECEVDGAVGNEGFVVWPSRFGAELYLWGYGFGGEDENFILNHHSQFGELEGVPISMEGVVACHALTD